MADLDGLKKVLRSLVVSSAATMDAAALLRDYRRMMGEPLPAARYGFRDPVLFLRERCADCFLFHGPHGNPILTLIVPDSIKHIDQLVQSQKTSKLIRGKRRSVPESILRKPQTNLIASTFNRVPPKVEECNRNSIPNKPTHIEKPQPERPRAYQTYTEYRKPEPPPVVTKPIPTTTKPVVRQPDTHAESKPSEAPVKEGLSNSHEDGAYSRQKLQRFLEKRMPVYQSQRLSVSKESLKDDDSGRQTSSSLSSRSAAALSTLQAEILRLVARRPAGVCCSDLLRLYEEEYGRELNFARFRYPSVSACACAVDGLVARRAPNGDWLLTLQGEQESAHLPAALRLRRTPLGSRPASRAQLDPDDALPGIDYDPDVFPADCLSFLESIPGGSVAGVAPGDMLGVVVGEVYSPSHLWLLRLGPEFELMEHFMDEMTEYYSKGSGADRVLAAGARRPGQYCSSVFEGDWHRSLIVQIVDSDTVKVRHVDYGTVDTVPASSLRPLRREWASLPAQAVRARLAGLRPAAACRRWPRPAAAHLLQLVRERRLVGNVVCVDHEENILEVFLIDTSTDEDINISDQMIRAGHADPRPLPALGARESYLLPTFSALEAGATPNYAEIHALLRDGIELEYVDAYRRHVASLLPTSSEGSDSTEPPPRAEADGALGSDDADTSELGSSPEPPPPPPSPPPPLAGNRVPMALSLLRLVSVSPEPARASPSPSPAPSYSAATPSPPLSPVSEARQPSPAPSPAPSPVPAQPAPAPCPAPAPAPCPAPAPPAAPAPCAAPAPTPPAPGPCCGGQTRAPHPASFYALPTFCRCSPGPCCPKPLEPVPGSVPFRYAPGYVRRRVSPQPPPPHFFAQYPRPPVSVGYYPNLLQPVFSSPNLHNFSPAQPLNFAPNSVQNPPIFGPNSAPHQFAPSFAPNPQNFGPSFTQAPQRFGPGPAPPAQAFGSNPAPSAQKMGPNPAPSPQNVGPNSSPNPAVPGQPPSGAGPSGGPDSTVRLSAEECEFFELLSRVDPGAAHRFMIAALRRARGAGAPDRAGSAPPNVSSGLNPDAAEFRSPTNSSVRPPPGFENFIK